MKKVSDLLRKGFKYLFNPDYRFQVNSGRGFYHWMSDEKYLKRIFKIRLGYELNLDDPSTYNEKLQWLKLYDHNPDYIDYVDKIEAKRVVTEKIGQQFIIPLLGVWDKFEDIDFSKLPNQFVLKCSHDSGGLVICKDKKQFDIKKAKKKINRALKRNYFWQGREWPYKNVKPRILAEKYMEDAETKELRDYKFFCFNGVPKALFIATDRGSSEETKFDFYDAAYKHLPITNGHPNSEVQPKKPQCFEEMLQLASKLSQGISHIRVDFYEVNGQVYFGELTLCHWSGLVPFNPKEWDKTFGDWITLPNRK